MPDQLNVPAPSVASQQVVGTMLGNITEWVGRGTIEQPVGIAAAALRVGVPKQDLAIDKDD